MSGPAVTFLSHTARPGGAELALRRYLLRAQVPVRLVTMEEGEVWEGLPCPVEVAATLPAVARALRRHDGPVVANSMRAALVGALAAPRRRPLAYWVRDGLTDSAMSPLALALTRHVTARRVSSYLANSAWTAGTVRAALGVDPARVEVVQSLCGTDGPAPPPRGGPRTPVRLLYLGRLAAWKAPDVAVLALRRLREEGLDVSLTVAGAAQFGETAYADRLAALADRVGGVRLLGHVDDVPGLLAEHDLTLHCSLRPEPFGQVVVQSLAAGVPVVVSEGGGPQETLAGAPVDLVHRPGDAAGLAAAVRRALAAYPLVSTWALERATQLGDRPAAARTDEVLARLLQQPDPDRPRTHRRSTP